MAVVKRFQNVDSFFPDKVESVGAVRRVYYHALYTMYNMDDVTHEVVGNIFYEWHYFGTTVAEKPPTFHLEAQTFQNTYISFPVDFENLPPQWANDVYYQMGMIAGRWKEGYKEGLE